MFEPNCQLISKKKVIKDKSGVEKTFINYYLVYENGIEVAIKPSFDTDYGKLSVKAIRKE